MLKKAFIYFTLLFSFLININSFANEEIAYSCKRTINEDSFSKKIEEKKNCIQNALLKSAKACMCAKGPYINLSGLIWQSKEGNLEFAAKDRVSNALDTNHKEKLEIGIPDFGWRPGLKLEAGIYTNYDDWDTKAIWTFYKGEFTLVKNHINVELTPVNNGVVPLYFFNYFNSKTSPPLRFTNATANWSMYFNSIDLEIARNFFITRRLSLRLLMGLKGAWINHDYYVEYLTSNRISSITGSTDDYEINKSIINFKNDSIGIGPRVGFEAKCHLIWGFKLLANASLSELLTNFEIRRNQADTIHNFIDDEQQDIQNKLKDDFSSIKPNLQLVLGFEWGMCFQKKVNLVLSLAYEMQYFFAQNQIRRFMDNNNIGQTFSNRGDLQLQGLTASLKLEF